MDASTFDRLAEEHLWPTPDDNDHDFIRYEYTTEQDEVCEEEQAERDAFAAWESERYEARMADFDVEDAFLDAQWEAQYEADCDLGFEG